MDISRRRLLAAAGLLGVAATARASRSRAVTGVGSVRSTSPRVALVIGIGAYEGEDELPNAVADAQAMAARLRELEFDVLDDYDLTRAEVFELVQRFVAKVMASEAAVVFLSGHGIQDTLYRQGHPPLTENFFIPLDGSADRSALWGDLQAPRPDTGDSVPMSKFTNALKLANDRAFAEGRDRVNLLWFDACRTSAMERRTRGNSGGRGLGPISVPDHTLVEFATRPGTPAADGDKPCTRDTCAVRGSHGHSPFTSAILEQLGTEGMELHHLTMAVRREVLAATAGAQLPQGTSSLTIPFYFREGVAARRRIHPGEVIGQDFAYIAGGSFTMGCVSGVDDANGLSCDPDEGAHRVRVADFELGTTELSRGVFRRVLRWGLEGKLQEAEALRSSGAGGSELLGAEPSEQDALPVTEVSWVDAVLWCRVATRMANAGLPSGAPRLRQAYELEWGPASTSGEPALVGVRWVEGAEGFRLPSEAEWEYAARGGEGAPRHQFPGGDDPDVPCGQRNISGCGGAPVAVADRRAVAHGLHHLSGNAWEWTWDRYDSSYAGAGERHADLTAGSYRVFRGGSFWSSARLARVSYRGGDEPSGAYQFLGFRVARGVPGPPAP